MQRVCDPRLTTLPLPMREDFEHALGEATEHVLLIALPYAVLSLLLLLFIEEKPMRQTVLRDDEIAAQPRVPTALASS